MIQLQERVEDWIYWDVPNDTLNQLHSLTYSNLMSCVNDIDEFIRIPLDEFCGSMQLEVENKIKSITLP